MNEEITEENGEEREDSLKENLEAVGQMIIGGIEQVGGIITGDSITRREGEYNLDAGTLHQEVNSDLNESDDDIAEDTEK